MKCSNCDKEPDKIVWIKRMVHGWTFTQKMDGEYIEDVDKAMPEYGRLEFLKMVKDDIKNNKNEGERFSCKPCFEEMDK